MKFSVIVPTFNRKDTLKNCLESLINQDYPKKYYEIIVADDGSEDGTAESIKELKKMFENLRYCRIRHKGPGAARNKAMRMARGRYIAFTDDDCIVEKGWLKKIERAFNKTNADAVGGTIINPTDNYIAHTAHIVQFCSWFPSGRRRQMHNIPTANVAYNSGSIKGYYFQESLGSAGYEDSLFNYHLYKKGRKILFCPDIAVKHYSWEKGHRLKRFFYIEKRSAMGFVLGGHAVHDKVGNILMRFKMLNLLCPYLVYVFIKCLRSRNTIRFFYHLPLMIAGEIYKAIVIMSFRPPSR